MPVEQVTVAYVNPPKDGGKKGSIKDMHGRYFGVWPDKLALYQKGNTYEIEYDVEEYQGRTYRNVKRIINGAGGTHAPSGRGAPTPAAGRGMDTKSVEMAVMGIIGRAFQGTGTIPDEAALTRMVRTIRKAWVNGFNDELSHPPEQYENELNDEVPF